MSAKCNLQLRTELLLLRAGQVYVGFSAAPGWHGSVPAAACCADIFICANSTHPIWFAAATGIRMLHVYVIIEKIDIS